MAPINQFFSYLSVINKQRIKIIKADPVADKMYKMFGKIGPVLNKKVEGSFPI